MDGAPGWGEVVVAHGVPAGGEVTQRYLYAWGNNERRAAFKGRECVLEATGRMVRFVDTGERLTTSRRAIRKVARASA